MLPPPWSPQFPNRVTGPTPPVTGLSSDSPPGSCVIHAVRCLTGVFDPWFPVRVLLVTVPSWDSWTVGWYRARRAGLGIKQCAHEIWPFIHWFWYIHSFPLLPAHGVTPFCMLHRIVVRVKSGLYFANDTPHMYVHNFYYCYCKLILVSTGSFIVWGCCRWPLLASKAVRCIHAADRSFGDVTIKKEWILFPRRVLVNDRILSVYK